MLSSPIDLFSDPNLSDPYPAYKELRDLGGVVWLERYGIWALPRYETTLAVLRDHRNFSSAENGVAFTPLAPGALRSTLTSDQPQHEVFRGIVADQLMPAAVRTLEQRIAHEAALVVDRVVEQPACDAMHELARHLPLTIVTELVGVPSELGQQLLDYSEARGNSFGPPALPRTEQGFAKLENMADLIARLTSRDTLRRDSMGSAIFAAADRGEIPIEQAPVLMRDYLGPSLDTTVAGIGNLIWLLASHPEQWDVLVSEVSLVGAAVDEALRLESPIQFFCRTCVVDTVIDGAHIARGDRLLVMYGSANRDERKWADADTMDIRRKGLNAQLSFGGGIHSCAGRHLARSEIICLLQNIIEKVERIDFLSCERSLNNTLRSFRSLVVSMIPRLQASN